MILRVTVSGKRCLNTFFSWLAIAFVLHFLLVTFQFGPSLKALYDPLAAVGAVESSAKSAPSLCPIPDIFHGRWVNVTYDAPPYIPKLGSESYKKVCRDFSGSSNTSFHTYEWEPFAVKEQGCQFANFNVESYCHVMRNKTVAIVGDSISFDHFLSLTHLLGVPQVLPKVRAKESLTISRVCQNTSILLGKRDFYLQSLPQILEDFGPDVLVLNRGAHFAQDDKLLSDLQTIAFDKVRNWQRDHCKKNGKECLFIWRTTMPGHPNCQNFTIPVNNLTSIEDNLYLQTDERYRNFHWSKFQGQNRLVQEALQGFNISHEIMDGYPAMMMRPDLHKAQKPGQDCLHTVSLSV